MQGGEEYVMQGRAFPEWVKEALHTNHKEQGSSVGEKTAYGLGFEGVGQWGEVRLEGAHSRARRGCAGCGRGRGSLCRE